VAWAGAAPEPHRCDLFHWARVERPEGIQPSVILWRCLTSPIVANFCSHKWQLSKFIFFLLFGKSNYPESDIKVSQKMNNGEVPVAVNGHDELQTTIKVGSKRRLFWKKPKEVFESLISFAWRPLDGADHPLPSFNSYLLLLLLDYWVKCSIRLDWKINVK